MGLTRFPGGLTSLGLPVFPSGGLIPFTTGEYFWVDSNNTMAGGDGSFDHPVQTLAAAYVKCVASRNDVIIMKAGHAETISANAALTLNKIGVSIIGLGQGSLRPTLTLTGSSAAVTITVSAANQLFRNFITSAGRDELVAVFTISAAGCTIDAVDYVEDDVTHQCITWITTTTGAKQLTVMNCMLVQITAPAGNGFAIRLIGADDCKIMNNLIHWLTTNNAGSGGIGITGTAALRSTVTGNKIMVRGGASVLSLAPLAATTGVWAYNYAGNANAAASNIGVTGIGFFENYVSNAGTTQGILDPAAGA